MAINKLGTPMKVLQIAKSAQEFSDMWNQIEKKNELINCISCNHLISKRLNNTITIKHRKVAAVIKNGEISIVCPHCSAVNNITLG